VDSPFVSIAARFLVGVSERVSVLAFFCFVIAADRRDAVSHDNDPSDTDEYR
jgi:hypothetical protein